MGCGAFFRRGVFTVSGGAPFFPETHGYRRGRKARAVLVGENMMRPSNFTASLAATALSGVVLAGPGLAEESYDLGEITVSGNLTPTAQARSGASVDILGGEVLERADAPLSSVLSRVPGVSASVDGGLGGSTNLRIRGLSNSYVGVRIDGIDVTDPSGTQTSFNFGGLTTAGIGRVEVLKGSQSALYGSEAIGGVIDITTFRPERLGFSGKAAAEAGSFGTWSGSLSLGQKSEQGEVALTFSTLRSEGISARAGDTEKDGFEQKMLTFSLRHELSDNLTVGASALWRDVEVEIDRSAADNSGITYSTQRGGRIFAELTTGPVLHRLSYAVFNSERRDPGGFTTMFDGERKQLSYLASAELGGAAKLNFGLDKTEESFRSTTDAGSYDTNSAMAELQLSPTPDLDLSLTARFDDHSRFGGNWSGRIAAAWRASGQTTLRAVLGTGFRAPSLYELYSAFGDPSLKPEKSRSAELGVEHRFAGGAGEVKATLFYTEIDDLIGFDGASVVCASGFGCYNQVPGMTVSKGLELSSSYALSDRATIYGNYTYTDARNSGARLQKVPLHDLVLGLDARLGQRFSANVEAQNVAGNLASAFAPAGHKVGDYTLVNLGLRYDVSDAAQAYLRVENVLDEDYETTGGFNQPGRAVYFGLRAAF